MNVITFEFKAILPEIYWWLYFETGDIAYEIYIVGVFYIPL